MYHIVVTGDSLDPAAIRRPLLQPAFREAFGVAIDKRGCGSAQRKVTRQVGRESGLAATALGVQYNDLVQIVSIRCIGHLSVEACLFLMAIYQAAKLSLDQYSPRYGSCNLSRFNNGIIREKKHEESGSDRPDR